MPGRLRSTAIERAVKDIHLESIDEEFEDHVVGQYDPAITVSSPCPSANIGTIHLKPSRIDPASLP